MMNGFLYQKNKIKLLKKEKEKKKTEKENIKLKKNNNKMAKNYYHRVKEFINEMEKKPLVINDFKPLTNKVKNITKRDKNLFNQVKYNRYSFLRSNAYVEVKPKRNNLKENLKILCNTNKINELNKKICNLKEDKELKFLMNKYKNNNKIINLRRKISNKNNENKEPKNKYFSQKNLKKTYFESIITLMYKNKDVLYQNKIDNEELDRKKITYKEKKNFSERVALDVLVKCNKFSQKHISLKEIKKLR